MHFPSSTWSGLLLIGLAEISRAQTITSEPTGVTATTSATDVVITPDPLTTLLGDEFACWSSWISWSEASREFYQTPDTRPYTTYNYTLSYEWWYTVDTSSVAWTTLCDNVPRALDLITTHRFSTQYTIWNDTMTVAPPLLEFPQPEPTCTVVDDSPECSRLYTASSSSRSTGSVTKPPCTTINQCASASRCIIDADEATMLYWPVTTTNGDFCLQNGVTVTPTPTAPDGSPNTAVFEGLTVTSPYVYFIVPNASGVMSSRTRSSTWHKCGPTISALTASVLPDAVSSLFWAGNRLPTGANMTSFSFNWADLNTVPFENYYQQTCSRQAWHTPCDTIEAAYTPTVNLPTNIGASVTSGWENCTPWALITPTLVALQAGATMTAPTPPGPTNIYHY